MIFKMVYIVKSVPVADAIGIVWDYNMRIFISAFSIVD